MLRAESMCACVTLGTQEKSKLLLFLGDCQHFLLNKQRPPDLGASRGSPREDCDRQRWLSQSRQGSSGGPAEGAEDRQGGLG